MTNMVNIIKDYTAGKERFFAHRPTLIGVVAGVQFYEHPLYGDDVGLVAYDRRTGALGLTDFHDVPAPHELAK